MKQIVYLFFLLTISNCTYAQSDKKVHFGVHAGINVANLVIKASGLSYKPSSIVGLNTGLQVEIRIAENLFIQPEASFSQMGASYYPVPYSVFNGAFAPNDSSAGLEVKSLLNYIVVPVLLKYKVPQTGLALNIGIQGAYLVRASDQVSDNSVSVLVNSIDDYNKGESSLIGGMEYYFKFGLGIAVRYQQGITSIQQDANNAGTVKNQAFTFTVGYRFY